MSIKDLYTLSKLKLNQELYTEVRKLGNINATSEQGVSLIFIAVITNNTDFAAQLILNKISLNNPDFKTHNPLLAAILCRNHTMVVTLIRGGACPHYKSSSGLTLMHYAAHGGMIKIAKTLYNRSIKMNEMTVLGETPLHFACISGKTDMVRWLLQKEGVDKNSINPFKGWTPMHYAAYYGYKDIVVVLLECGACYDYFDNDGNTPLQLATNMNHKNVVDVLFSAHWNGYW